MAQVSRDSGRQRRISATSRLRANIVTVADTDSGNSQVGRRRRILL
jgi:hypothetical protein